MLQEGVRSASSEGVCRHTCSGRKPLVQNGRDGSTDSEDNSAVGEAMTTRKQRTAEEWAFEIEGCAHYDRCHGEAQGHKAPGCKPFCYQYNRTVKIIRRILKARR